MSALGIQKRLEPQIGRISKTEIEQPGELPSVKMKDRIHFSINGITFSATIAKDLG